MVALLSTSLPEAALTALAAPAALTGGEGYEDACSLLVGPVGLAAPVFLVPARLDGGDAAHEEEDALLPQTNSHAATTAQAHATGQGLTS